jgi:hypothetical protein
VSVTERGHDSRRLLIRVYDDHQPATRPGLSLEEPHSVGPTVGFSVVWRADRVQQGMQMRLELGVTAVRIENVLEPGVLEEDYP